LPTEAEWEVACRGGTSSAYSFGNDARLFGHYGWSVENSDLWSHSVGRLRPNPRGLFDVHGNQIEFCHDGFREFVLDAVDPIGAPEASYRVGRGGNWTLLAAVCRSTIRAGVEAGAWDAETGFRVAVCPVTRDGGAEREAPAENP
jgi:formylglycine-generating enzyme required for sulfatase activity